MKTTMREKADALVKTYVWGQLSDEAKKLVGSATFDLYYGPYEPDEGENWPGFSDAVDTISDSFSEVGRELWVDMDCEEVLEREPRGETDEETGEWVEPFLENVYHYEGRDVKRAAFGELGSYL